MAAGPDFFGREGSVDEFARRSFLESASDSRHHFRLIVSPEKARGLDLSEFTRILVGQMESDLGTELRWLATSHHDTDHPHIHLVIHGLDQAGRDLVLKRDYLTRGIRYRACDIAELLVDQRPRIEVAAPEAPQRGREIGFD